MSKLVWDGTVQSCLAIRRAIPAEAVDIYAMQSRLADGSYIFDPLYGVPVLRVGDRLIEIGGEV